MNEKNQMGHIKTFLLNLVGMPVLVVMLMLPVVLFSALFGKEVFNTVGCLAIVAAIHLIPFLWGMCLLGCIGHLWSDEFKR